MIDILEIIRLNIRNLDRRYKYCFVWRSDHWEWFNKIVIADLWGDYEIPNDLNGLLFCGVYHFEDKTMQKPFIIRKMVNKI